MIVDMTQNTSKRRTSLDAFRGFTIMAMILVNTPGSWEYVFPPLRHARWNGLTPTDLVFPFFLFIVGVSIVLAYHHRLANNAPKQKLVLKIIKRSILIFLLGVLLNLVGSNFQELRLPGVLQRIALVFLICSLLFLFTSLTTQIWTGVGLLIGFYLVMKLIWAPEGGILLPGNNLANKIDQLLIPLTLYQGTWDPEGLLSTLPSIATGIMGMVAGHLIISQKSMNDQVILLFVGGFFMMMAGEIWSWFFPINKNLWTSSYVLYTGGLAAMSWAVLIWLMDIKRLTRWGKAGVIFGSNAISAYVLSYILLIPFTYFTVVDGKNLQEVFMAGFMNMGWNPEWVSLLWAILFTLLCFIPVWMLYRKRIFLKI